MSFILPIRQTLRACNEIVSGSFHILFNIIIVKPAESPNATCVRPDRFRQSGPLTIPLLLGSLADPVGSPNAACVRPNRFGSSQASLSCILPSRKTLHMCSQRVCGGGFLRRLSRTPLAGPLGCHQTQPTQLCLRICSLSTKRYKNQ